MMLNYNLKHPISVGCFLLCRRECCRMASVSVDWNNSQVFKTWNYKYFREDTRLIVIDAIAILIGEYAIERKQAAMLLLKTLLTEKFFHKLFKDYSMYPFKRSDSRVCEWKNKILSVGECQKCGSKEHLEAHHVLHWSDFPMGRIDVKNGRCLCQYCHADEHVGETVHSAMVAKFR